MLVSSSLSPTASAEGVSCFQPHHIPNRQAYLLTLPEGPDLHKALDITRPLRLRMILQNEPLSDEELVAIAKKLKLGRWNFYSTIYEPEPIRNVLWNTIKEAFSAIDRAQFILSETTQDDPVLQTRNIALQGIPSLDELAWVNWGPKWCAPVLFSIAKITGDDGMLQYSMTKKRCTEAGIDFIGTFTIGMREMHHIVCIFLDRYNKEKRGRAHWLSRTLIQEAAENGWGEYWTHLALMDQISDTYCSNDNAQRKLNETIKNALGPKGILAPGKNGVWPSNYDREAWKICAPDPF